MHYHVSVDAPRSFQAVRVQSIDLLRGLDVLLMLLVNDLAGVTGTPAFLRHAAGNVDAMTITDVVFPAFLFITGMAIPLALDGRVRRGEAPGSVWRHVLTRALSLIVIGVFMVNGEYGKPGGLLPPEQWYTLMMLAVICLWHASHARPTGPASPAAAPSVLSARSERSAPSSPSASPRSLGSPESADSPASPAPTPSTPSTSNVSPETRAQHALFAPGTLRRIAAALVLAALVIVYHSGEPGDGLDFRARWWGILGLIGWAYLGAATLYLCARYLWPRYTLPWVLGAAVLLYALRIVDQMGFLAWAGGLRPYLSVALETQTAIVLNGTALTVLLTRHRQADRPLAAFVPIALAYTVALAAAGLLLHGAHDLHRAFWFSKIQATAAWGLISSALTAGAFTVLFWLVDLRGWRRWPALVSDAGEQALTVYLLAPLLLALIGLSGALLGMDWYAAIGRITPAGFLRAALFAWLTVALAAWLRDRGLRLRL